MRKIILLTLAIIAFSQIQAQFQKGQLYADITGGARVVKYNSTSVQPSIMIGLGDHSAIGFFYDYTKVRQTENYGIKGESSSYAVGVSYNYYHFFGKSQKWGWFVKADLARNHYTNYSWVNGGPRQTLEYNETALSITPGIFFKASPRITLHADIGPISLIQSRMDGVTVRSGFASQLNIGATINLGNTKKKNDIKQVHF